jgi:hypothetical protein
MFKPIRSEEKASGTLKKKAPAVQSFLFILQPPEFESIILICNFPSFSQMGASWFRSGV